MKKPTLRERLLSKAVINFETGCWEWTASKGANGYGQIWADGRIQPTHRVAFELIEGPIPEGLQLDHLCRNRACCNPAHLEPVTQQENNRRGKSLTALNAAKTRCSRGHEFTSENTYVYGNGGRKCRACRCIDQKQYRATHRDQLNAKDRERWRRIVAARLLEVTP